MVTHKMVITIDNFDNAAMADNPNFEVFQMLRELTNRIKTNGVVDCNDVRLRDSNGNTVGKVVVDFDEPDEDDDAYDATQDEDSEDY